MPTYKLTYFDAKGLGEGIRMLLTYMDKEFEDYRIALITDPTSPWLKVKPEIKFGKIPVLEIDGQKIYQSTAICRYLAVEAGLNGSNAWENLQIDIIAGAFKDFTTEFVSTFKEGNPELKAEKFKVLKEKTIPYYFGTFDEIAKNNSGYLANGKLSWIDLLFLGFAETSEGFTQEPLFEKHPNLKALKEKVHAIPKIKKWVDKRPQSPY